MNTSYRVLQAIRVNVCPAHHKVQSGCMIVGRNGTSQFTTVQTDVRFLFLQLTEVGQTSVCLMYRGVIPEEPHFGMSY